MNSQKIFIYECEILFNILNEIRENFNFDIVKVNKENFNLLEKDLKDNSLVITKSGEVLSNVDIFIDSRPIKINKLIQTINLKLLKKTFSFQSEILIGNYKLNLNVRNISLNDIVLDLTEREINLIIFLKKSSAPVKIDELQKEVWDYGSELETHTVETHIYRLRKKIKEKFNDDSFIVSSKKGYKLIEKKK